MGRRRSAQDADLQRLYDQVPDANCKGLCASACGPIDLSPREASRLREVGVEIPMVTEQLIMEHVRGGAACPALTEQGRCGAYGRRPMICRLWGATESLRCPHGCVPAAGPLSDIDAVALVMDAARVGGAPALAQNNAPGLEYARSSPERGRLLSAAISTLANRPVSE